MSGFCGSGPPQSRGQPRSRWVMITPGPWDAAPPEGNRSVRARPAGYFYRRGSPSFGVALDQAESLAADETAEGADHPPVAEELLSRFRVGAQHPGLGVDHGRARPKRVDPEVPGGLGEARLGE